MRIVSATTPDLTRIEALLSELGLPTAGLRAQFPLAYVTAMRDGKMLGCAGLEVYEGVGLLRSLAVTASERNKGIGRALMSDRIASARAEGLEAVYLLTTTAADYLRSFGFSPVDKEAVPRALALSPEFAGACPASATCLGLHLRPATAGAVWAKRPG